MTCPHFRTVSPDFAVALATGPSASEEIIRLVAELGQGGEVGKEAHDRLIAFGGGATEELLRQLDSPDADVRWAIVDILGITKDPLGTERLLQKALHDENPHVRWRSLWALTRIKSAEIPAMFRAALASQDRVVRFNAAVGCSLLAIPEALPVLYEGLESADEFTAWEAINALSRIHEPTSIGRLEVVLQRAGASSRREVVLALGSMDYPEAVPVILKTLNDEDPGVRLRAVMVLGRFKVESVRNALEERRTTETDPEVVGAIDDTLRRTEVGR